MNNNGKWIKFETEDEMKIHYNNNKFFVDYPDYPEQFTPGWYYVCTEGRYYRRGATDHYLCFIKAVDRIQQVKEAMVELAEELRTARINSQQQ